MARTDRFRLQHTELLQLAGQLDALLKPAELALDGTAARSCLSKLIGKLTLHLSSEDKLFYPELVSHKDTTVAALARRFSEEMKTTAPQVIAYNAKWSTPSAIKANPDAFIKETKQVISILGNRIKRENQELYAAADRTEGNVFA